MAERLHYTGGQEVTPRHSHERGTISRRGRIAAFLVGLGAALGFAGGCGPEGSKPAPHDTAGGDTATDTLSRTDTAVFPDVTEGDAGYPKDGIAETEEDAGPDQDVVTPPDTTVNPDTAEPVDTAKQTDTVPDDTAKPDTVTPPDTDADPDILPPVPGSPVLNQFEFTVLPGETATLTGTLPDPDLTYFIVLKRTDLPNSKSDDPNAGIEFIPHNPGDGDFSVELAPGKYTIAAADQQQRTSSTAGPVQVTEADVTPPSAPTVDSVSLTPGCTSFTVNLTPSEDSAETHLYRNGELILVGDITDGLASLTADTEEGDEDAVFTVAVADEAGNVSTQVPVEFPAPEPGEIEIDTTKTDGYIISGLSNPVTITAPGALSYTAKLEMLNGEPPNYPGTFDTPEGAIGEDGVIDMIYKVGGPSGLIVRMTVTCYGMGGKTAEVQKKFTL